MREQLEQAKEYLEQKRIIGSDNLFVIFNKVSNNHEILIKIGETKQTKDGETTKFKNLNGESIKIIYKGTRVYIKPKKYDYKSVRKLNILDTKDEYFMDELGEIEEMINKEQTQIRARKKNA